MADNAGGEHDTFVESHDSSSSEDEKKDNIKKSPPVVVVDNNNNNKVKIYRLFGRERPLHKLLGAGKPADIFLWRDKKVSAGVIAFATVIWALFELLEYHLLTLVCHILIVSLAVLFLWSNVSAFINTTPPQIPEVVLPKDVVVGVASALRIEINSALEILREVASGKDLKKFLIVIAGLWVVSILGNCWNFLTLVYIVFVLLHTIPVLYEKYEDKVDAFAEKAEVEIKKHYAVFDAQVLSKIPRGPLKNKKLV